METATDVEKSVQAARHAPVESPIAGTPFEELPYDAPKAEETDGTSEDATPGIWTIVWLTTGLCMGIFCVALDNTILATAIPKISLNFKTISDVGWYGSVYFLTICSVTLLFGKLYTLYPLKWTFCAALFLFELGSLLCGVAPTSTALIIGRAIAGLGSGGIFPGAVLIMSETVPLEKRALYNALITGMAGIAGVTGPLIGGAFTNHLTWRWCFYINLPCGAVTALAVLFSYHDKERSARSQLSWREKMGHLDLWGLFIFVPAIVCLFLPLQWAGTKYHWQNARIIVLFILFGVLIAVWAAIQRWKQERATVPPRLIAMRNVWATAVYTVFFSGSYYVMAYYFPIWFQAVKGASAMSSGIMSIPMIAGISLCTLIGGIAVNMIGHYMPLMYLGTIILSIGCGMCSTLTATSGHPEWIGYQALVGIGAGFGFNIPLIAVQASLPPDDIATATAIVMFAQNLSGALFIAIAQNLFQNRLVAAVVQYAPDVAPGDVIAAGAADLASSFSPAVLPQLQEAYNAATTQTFYLPVAGSALSILGAVFLEWLSVKREKTAKVPAVVH
ncbi:MDR family MFS transporter [Aspergillus aculeatinus CBS 121060]|uniref:MFS general substrate transporter n=1 Tax=Aspergillus aculeatinus CBS 121060 TaxID=1448322 RepID=A0ACD1H5Y1_9EURO|nr:MFS general substrate transporter [Aspergillus aculeatinus CBS 121060]RAH68809.1 MFS general substrate transporter [Aspergillus aculeatinus CBS 121060]